MTRRQGLLARTYAAALAALVVAALSWTAAAQKKPSVWDGVYTSAQADRGQAAFVKSCGGCHRDDMSGGDDSEPPLRGAHFTDKWEGASVAEIYDFVANNMPKSKPGSLPLETCIDIVAFMLKSNEM